MASDPRPEEPEPRPTINPFELWEDGSQQAKAVSGRGYHFPMCFVVLCPWLSCLKALSLRDVGEGVAHNLRDIGRMDGVARNWLSPGIHFPKQPSLSKESIESNSLTFWWGLTLCPPEMNDVALAENAVTAMRVAAAKELTMTAEIDKLTLKSVLEFDADRMIPAEESTPHAKCDDLFMDDDSEDTEARRNLAKVQTGERIPLPSTSDFRLPTNPWPKSDEVVNNKNACALTQDILAIAGISMVIRHLQLQHRCLPKKVVLPW